MGMRTDPHRPGAIIPTDYVRICWYVLPGADPQEDPGCTEELATFYREAPDAAFFPADAREGKCGVCGARFRAGEVWRHEPTGEHIHLGHDCGSKYNLLADRSQWEAWHVADRERRAKAIQARKRATERDAYLDARPELRTALAMLESPRARELDAKVAAYHAMQADLSAPEAPALTYAERAERRDVEVLRDMSNKLTRFGSLSDAQVHYALKLADKLRQAPKPEEAHVPAPEGRLVVRGRIVSTKVQEGDWGPSYKMVVKVETPEGSWLCWSTIPSVGVQGSIEELRGKEVEFTATLTRSDRDAHFAFAKRPTKAFLFEATA